MELLGLLVNPHDLSLCCVFKEKERTVTIRDLAGGWIGEGYFDGHKEPHDEYAVAYDVTGLPRAHTPAGVKPKGAGWGTCLYTGLCVAAHEATKWTDVLVGMHGAEGDGISSKDRRSAEAAAWWRQAIQIRLARRETGEVESDEEEFEINRAGSTSRMPSGLRDVVDSLATSEIREIHSWSLQVSGTLESGESEQEADAYDYDAAAGHHLVVCACYQPTATRLSDLDPYDLDDPHLDVLLAANVAALRGPRYVAPGDDPLKMRPAMQKLLDLATTMGASLGQRAGMLERFLRGVDIEPDLAPGEVYVPEGVRRNPARRRALRVKRYAPRVNPTSGALTKTTDAALLAPLAALRARLGYDRLARLP